MWPYLGKPGLMEIELSQFSFKTNFNPFPKHFKPLAMLSNVRKSFRSIQETFQMFAKRFSLTSFLCIVCQVFACEVTFWNIELKARFASSESWNGSKLNLLCALTIYTLLASLECWNYLYYKRPQSIEKQRHLHRNISGYVRGHKCCHVTKWKCNEIHHFSRGASSLLIFKIRLETTIFV